MFENEILKFNNNYDAIKSFIDLVEPVLEEKYRENIKKNRDDLILLQLMFDSLVPEDEIKISDEYKKKIEENFDGEFIIEKDEDGEGVKLSVSGEGGERFQRALSRMRESYTQKQLLYKSCLMNMISAVECYFADLLKTYYNEYPGEISSTLLKGNDKIFAYSQLALFENMEDARNYTIDTKIDSLIRGNFLEWIDFLQQSINLKMGYLNSFKTIMYEVFLRRNLFVHNDGIVNSVYLANVDKKLDESKEEKGNQIYLEKEYLIKNIDIFETNFTLIGLELWKKNKQTDQARYEFIADLIYRNMDLKRWNLVNSFTVFLMKEGSCPQKLKNMAKINNWLSHKKLGTFQDIREEVINEDFSACSNDFIMCKYALLEKKEETLYYFDEFLRTEDVDADKISEWPVLEIYKNIIEFKEIVNKHKKEH